MAEKFERDQRSNAQLQDTYIHASQEPWLPGFSDGIDFKLLRASQETGAWTVLIRARKGAAIARHEHLGAGEYYMVSGKMEVRGGVESGGITAYGGDYGYEPNGMIHDSTNFPEESVLYFTNYGPIRFMDDENKTIHVHDWQSVLKAAEEGRRKLAG